RVALREHGGLIPAFAGATITGPGEGPADGGGAAPRERQPAPPTRAETPATAPRSTEPARPVAPERPVPPRTPAPGGDGGPAPERPSDGEPQRESRLTSTAGAGRPKGKKRRGRPKRKHGRAR